MSNSSLSLVLFLLWIVWAVLLFGGGFIGKPDADYTRRMPRWTRMASSLVLVMAAWGYAVIYREQAYADVAGLLAVGMTLCFIGDLFMAELILRDDRHILGGIGAFGLGHVAYIAAFLRLLAYSPVLLDWRVGGLVNDGIVVLPEAKINGLVLIGCWLVAAMVWYVVVYRAATERTVLHVAALPYGLLLATTVGTALNVTLYAWEVYSVSNASQAALLNFGRAAVPALGAVLFFISDFILAARLFNKAYFRMIDDWVWLTYGPGQMLIVYGVGLMMMSIVFSR
jgi:hypothetical protein